MNAFVVVNVVKCCTQMGQHKRVGGENRGRNWRASIDGKERADSRELVANFFFLDVEEASNVLDHLLMGKSQLITGRAVRRRGSDDVGSVASTVGRRRGTGRNENGRGQARHGWNGWTVMWYV